jgi:NitT/TauT family transport system substrate-binding protein
VRQKLFMLSIILIFIFGCSAKSEPTNEKPVIKIGYLPITHAAPLLLDHHLHEGEYDDYKLELVKFSSWPDLIDALNAGQIDGASVLMQLAMQAKDIGIDLKAVALGHRDGNVIISAKDVNEVADLKDTTFAIPHTHSAHHLLINELLQKEGLSYDDVNLVEMPPPEMPAALAEGRISGYAVAEPFGALAVNLDVGKVLAFSESFWPDSYCCVLVLRTDFIEQNEPITKQFIHHYVNAGHIANEKGDELYEALQTYMDVDENVLDISLQWITYDNLHIDEDEYAKLSDRIKQLNLMEEPPHYDDFVEHRFLDEVIAENE